MMRTTRRVGFGMRAAAIALAGALLMAGCATQPEPEQDPFGAATAELLVQLEQIDGIADVRQVLNALDFSISYSVTDAALAEQATLEVIDTYEASDVPGALKKETAAYSDDAQLSLNIIEVGAPGGDIPHLELPVPPDADVTTVARGVAAWARMEAIGGVELRTSTFSASGFELAYTVGYGGLLDGVRPTAVAAQMNQIITDTGLDPSTSTFAAALRAPDLLNSVDGEPKYVQGTSLDRADQPLKAVAGPNYGSVLYFAPENFTLDIVLLPSLAPDGTLLPLDLTSEAVLAAAPVIQADIDSRWTLRDVVVFTQDGSQTYPMRAS
ncbi:hypothetical protein ASF06_01255 [Agreia sp. Leaf244]|nr:hypothetical protein ASF06_01255 [Agreia sp. Leaf244]